MTSAESLDFTDEQLKERKKSIGASECGSVLGVQGAYKTPYSVWLDKTSEEIEPQVNSIYTRRGSILEPYVIKATELKWGKEIWASKKKFWHKRKSFLTATPDGWYAKEGEAKPCEEIELVQIKTSSENLEGNYGMQGSSDVPLNYLFQCYHEMLVTGARSVDLIVYFATQEQFDATIYMTECLDVEGVALYIRNCNLQKFHIARNDERLKKLETLLTEFWSKVQGKIAPTRRNSEDFIFEKPESEYIDFDNPELGPAALADSEVMQYYLEKKIGFDSAQEDYKKARKLLDESLREGTIWHYGHISLEFKRNKSGLKTDWESLAKHSYVDRTAIAQCKKIVWQANLSERERLAIISGLDKNDLTPQLFDRFLKSANSISRPLEKQVIQAFTELSDKCRIPPEIQAEYTHSHPGAKVLRSKKDK